MLVAQKEFFHTLFTSDPNVKFTAKNENDIKISDLEKNLVDKELTLEELGQVIKSMPNGKTPGCDGLPVEFYKVFWNRIGDWVLDAFNYAFQEGTLHIYTRRGVITLIPKKDKDPHYIKNWRPLTLLNCDYKILANTLTNRLKACLQKLIHSDQTGFMKNRFIGENIRKILDIVEYTEQEDIPALLISVDFEKCFDRVEWSAVQGALKYFNFGDNFIKWIQILYAGIESCTFNNGFTSEWFKPSRGLRQGCPISPYLFLVTAEILAIYIRKNKNIRGIKINDIEYKLLQYSDDTNLFSQY